MKLSDRIGLVLRGIEMIKEYYDTFLNEDATEKLSKDIEANPGISFEIVGYTQVVVNDFFIRSVPMGK